MDARERRKARLQNGADRLAKITGKPVDAATLPKRPAASSPAAGSPSATAAPVIPSEPSRADEDDPPDVLPTQISNQASSSAGVHEKELANALADPNVLLNLEPGPKFGQKIGTSEKTKMWRPKWNILHSVSMVLIGLYACWNAYKLWQLFLGVEVSLVLARYTLDPTLEASIFRTLLQFIPANIGAKLSLPLFAVQALRNAYYDFCLVLFVWAGVSALYIQVV